MRVLEEQECLCSGLSSLATLCVLRQVLLWSMTTSADHVWLL
jgi:hypothetical protein